MTGSHELSLEVAEIEPRTSWPQADNAADICMAYKYFEIYHRTTFSLKIHSSNSSTPGSEKYVPSNYAAQI